MDFRTEWLTINGRRMRLLAADGGPRAVLCWPGTGEPAEECLGLMERGHNTGYTVAAIDPPGHGLSQPWPDSWDWRAAGLIIQEALAHLGHPAILAGHSLGGTTVLMAAPKPHGVLGMLVLDGGLPMAEPYATPEAVEEALKGWFQDNEFPDWNTFLFHVRAELRHWNSTVEAGLRAMMVEENAVIKPRGDLGTIAAMLWNLSQYQLEQVPASDLPTLMVLSEEKISAEDRSILKQRLPKLEVEELTAAGHELPWEAPDTVLQALEKLAARINWT